MKKYILIALVSASFNLVAQPSCQWAYMATATGNANHTVFNAVYDLNGDFIQAGNITGVADMNPGSAPTDTAYSSFGYNYYLAKYSPSGVLLWIQYFKSHGGFLSFDFTGIAVNSSNDIIVTGNYFGTVDFDLSDTGIDTISSHFPTYPDYFVAKYSSNGSYQWAFSIGNTQNNTIESRSVLIQANDDIVVAAHPGGIVDVDPSAAVHNCTPGNAVLVCYDVNGNYQWDANNMPANYSYAQYDKSFDTDAAGNIYMMTVGYYELTVTKFTPLGVKLWERKIGNFSSQARVTPQSILVDKQTGDFYVAGTFEGTVDFEPNAGINNLSSGTFNYQDGFIAKYDANMNLLWVNHYAGQMEFGKFGLAFLGNEIISAGKMKGNINLGNGTVLSNPTTVFNPFYLKISTGGATSNAFLINNPGYYNSITSNSNQTFLTTGGTLMNTDMDPTSNTYLLTSNTNGFAAIYTYGTTTVNEQWSEFDFGVYPNPANDFVSLILKQDCYLQLTNTMGRIVYSVYKKADEYNTIDVSALSNGIYFLRCGNAVKKVEVIR